MSQRIVVNGVEYDSPEAMPPDVRRQYEQAMALVKDMGQGGEKTVQSVPGGLKINVKTRQVLYNVEGKTYDDLSQLPPELRTKVERALAERSNIEPRGQGQTDVKLIDLQVERPKRRVSLLVWLVVVAIITAIVFLR